MSDFETKKKKELMWSMHSAVSVHKYAIRLIYELEKKRINNSCIGAIHGFLLWNL